jgi:hypothetical protein
MRKNASDPVHRDGILVVKETVGVKFFVPFVPPSGAMKLLATALGDHADGPVGVSTYSAA